MQKAASKPRPAPIDEVVATIRAKRPDLVFAPHVETASGIILPDDYLKAVADAVHEVGGLFVLIAWPRAVAGLTCKPPEWMLISASQKGWSGSPGCAFVLLSERARTAIEQTTSTSFAADLEKWLQIMETYEGGSHVSRHLPTETIARTRQMMLETREYGFDKVRQEQGN